MTKTEALKELLKYNLNKLAKNTSIGDLSINFVTVDKFMVLNKDKEVVFTDNLSNYDVDFESQKKFVLDVAESVAMTAMILEDLRPEDKNILENYLDSYDKNYIEITGYGPIHTSAPHRFYIEFKNFVMTLEDDYYEICKEFKNLMLDTFIWKIKNKVNRNKVRVFLHFNENKCNGFIIFVDSIMDKDVLPIGYINDIKKLEKIDNLKNPKFFVYPNENVLKHKLITLFYSVANVEELEKATDVIREAVYEYEKLFKKFWIRLKEN